MPVPESYINEWLELSRSGKFHLAREFYYESIFPTILIEFTEKYWKLAGSCEMLISVLGFSPEPIILTAAAANPTHHICLTNDNIDEGLEIMERFLDTRFAVHRLRSIEFKTIYKAMKEELVLANPSEVMVDITGGKKSMVASASIFAKDYGCKIVYVDFEDYLQELRKPLPGTEVLKLIYDPARDQPEIRVK